MLKRFRSAIAAAFLLVAAPSLAAPKTDLGGQTAVVPFDPPLGEPLRYRSESSDKKDGETTVSWSVDDMIFGETDDGYRLTVTPVSSGSNDNDPHRAAFMKQVDDLTKIPVVILIDAEVRITGIEREEEYWDRITEALRVALSSVAKTADQKKMLEGFVTVFETMPREARLAKLTESVQPLLEFALTETTVGQPIITEIETASPYGGTLKQEVTISLTRVDADFAYLTVRARLPGSEVERLTKRFLERLGGNFNDPAHASQREAGLAALRQMKVESVADYKIAREDGMLETFQSTQTIRAVADGKTAERIKTRSLTRVR